MNQVEALRRVAKALDFAARAHEGQQRGAGRREPFVSHVTDVARRVSESPAVDEETLLAALLHDVVEKTEHSLYEVEQTFGPVVAGIVSELTDNPSLSAKEQKQEQVATALHFSDRAKRIKLADQASKLASIAEAPPRWWWGRRKAIEEVKQTRRVASSLRAVNPVLEDAFNREAQRADQSLSQPMR